MTHEELNLLEGELLDRGAECPYAPFQPMSDMDKRWEAEYSEFCHERLTKLMSEDWVLVAAGPGLELLRSHIGEYAGECDLTKLTDTELIILLSAVPKLADKCNLSVLDAAAWENLIENCGEVFADEKYSVYPEWNNADKKTALEHHDVMASSVTPKSQFDKGTGTRFINNQIGELYDELKSEFGTL